MEYSPPFILKTSVSVKYLDIDFRSYGPLSAVLHYTFVRQTSINASKHITVYFCTQGATKVCTYVKRVESVY